MSPIRPILFSLSLMAAATRLLADDKPEQEKKPAPKFTISKETTYVSGPLDKEGYIDYETALNERLSKGVTAETNANVLLWKAVGPHPDGVKMPLEFFKLLGIEAPPERGQYFVDFVAFLRAQGKLAPDARTTEINDRLIAVSQRPWKAQDQPDIAAWLKANEEPLSLVAEATKRPHYFNPIIAQRKEERSGGLISALLPAVQKCRPLAWALNARAMLYLSQGKVDEAWQNLLASHCLGRLVARGGLVEGLVGNLLDQIASGADLAFLDRAKLSPRQLRLCLRDLQQLPPLPSTADKIDFTERLVFLDMVMIVQRGGIQAMESLAGAPPAPGKKPDPFGQLVSEQADWDYPLRTANRWYDRVAAILRVKDLTARRKLVEQFDVDIKALRKSAMDTEKVAKAIRMKEPLGKVLGEAMGEILASMLFPAFNKMQQAADLAEQRALNVRVAFALAAYRTDNGRYPPKPYDLAPKYLSKIPDDLFSGKPLIYRPDEKGYLLYSVGVNGKDDGGRQFDDDPPGDDLAVRMPLPERKKKE